MRAMVHIVKVYCLFQRMMVDCFGTTFSTPPLFLHSGDRVVAETSQEAIEAKKSKQCLE